MKKKSGTRPQCDMMISALVPAFGAAVPATKGHRLSQHRLRHRPLQQSHDAYRPEARIRDANGEVFRWSRGINQKDTRSAVAQPHRVWK